MAVFFRIKNIGNIIHVEIKSKVMKYRFDLTVQKNTIKIITKNKSKIINFNRKKKTKLEKVEKYILPTPQYPLCTILTQNSYFWISFGKDFFYHTNGSIKSYLILIIDLIKNTRGLVFDEKLKNLTINHIINKIQSELKIVLDIHYNGILFYVFKILKSLLTRRKKYGSNF